MSFLYIGMAHVDEILKTRTYLLYIVNITDADVLTTQWAWASPTMGILPEKTILWIAHAPGMRGTFFPAAVG